MLGNLSSLNLSHLIIILFIGLRKAHMGWCGLKLSMQVSMVTHILSTTREKDGQKHNNDIMLLCKEAQLHVHCASNIDM